MDAERTASSSRRSANCFDRSRGRVSKVCVYSERRESEYAAVRATVSEVIGIADAVRGGNCWCRCVA